MNISITKEEFEAICFAIDRIETDRILFEDEEFNGLSVKHLEALHRIDLKYRKARYEEKEITAFISLAKEQGQRISRTKARKLLHEYKII